MSGRKVVITGGSGFLGMNLARHLTGRGDEVVIVSRSAPAEAGAWRHAVWDGRTVGAWKDELDGADAVVNLAGRTVDCIKTADHCDEILRSRVESTRAVGEAVGEVESPPGVWVQMSTAHIYGDPPAVVCDETSALGYGLAPEVGRAWEAAYREGLRPGMRGVVLRTSFVLGRRGGAVRRLAALARWGLGGTVGSGGQGMSWIHEADMDRLFELAIDDSRMSGVYIASSPKPVSNRVFMGALRRALGVRMGLRAPGFLVRLGAPLILRTDPELALYGRYVISKRLDEVGFSFRYAEIEDALASLFADV